MYYVFVFIGHSLILPDECGHSLTIRNRTVGIKDESVLNSLTGFNQSFIRYSIMLNCWQGDPRRRPTFDQIVASLEVMMTRDTPYFDFNQLDESHSYYNIASLHSCTNEMKDEEGETAQSNMDLAELKSETPD